MTIAQHQVTRLLQEWNDGDASALDQLMPLVHDELHRLAHQHMRREGPGHILQTSALINQAYLRLVDQPEIRRKNRNHFFGIAAQLMRRILVDDARKRNSARRGGSLIQVPRLTNNLAYNDQPKWSPDGSKIAFISNRDGNFEIYTMNKLKWRPD